MNSKPTPLNPFPYLSLIIITSKVVAKDTLAFKSTTANATYTLSETKLAAINEWRNYPVMANRIEGDCIYRSFDDFRSDTKTTVGSITKKEPTDSLFLFD